MGLPPWQRAQLTCIDQVVDIPAPEACPHCQNPNLQPQTAVQEHVQEDIVLVPRTVATCFRHHQAYCPQCGQNVWQPGSGEIPGAYIGPTAKATATYLRRQLRALCRQPLHHPKAIAFSKRLLGPEQKRLFTCFRRPNVRPPITRPSQFRPVGIMCKVVLGTRSEHGLENQGVLRSLFETARRQG